MIDHERASELSASALDFALSPADREELQQHLDACSACRARDEHLRDDARAVADLAPHDAPGRLRARIVEVAGIAGAFEGTADARPNERRPNAASSPMPTIPPGYRRPAALLGAAAAIVVLIAGTLFWRAGPSAGPDAGPNTAAASPSAPVPSGSWSPVPTGKPGSPGSLATDDAWTPVADLTADDVQGGVVGLATGFRLASLDGTPAVEVAARLSADPPVAFAVAVDADGRSARITPTEPLTAGAVYRFTLTADDGRTLDSWAFQARQPLRVVGTVPNDTATDVPTNTGIEVTFDQDGVVDAASHMTIAPKVAGRFEQHDRALAFIPAKRLATSTIYTVTVSRGVTVKGTGEALESDVRFRFETTAAGTKGKVRTTFQFSDDLFESATATPPVIALWAFQDRDGDGPEPTPPKSARIEVHRLRDLDGGIVAYRQVRSFPYWARWAAVDLVPTAGLTRVAAFDAKLRTSDDVRWFQMPAALPAGWYVVTIRSGTRPIQAILQVTDIAGYLVVSETQTLVWANDLASGKPVVGAIVATDGTEVGRTDDDGSLMAETLAALKPTRDGSCTDGCVPVVTVRSGDRATFLPASGQRQYEWGSYSDQDPGAGYDAARYWSTFGTDRTLYRRTDTVNVWGVVRDRGTGKVPGAVTVRLFASREDGGSLGGATSGERAPLATIELHPNPVGAFSGSIALADVPEGDYSLEATVAGDVVGSGSFRVDRILKPAYRLDVSTGRRVYFQGDRIKVTATATFYEGSPVPGVPLRLDGFVEKTFTTDKTGTATLRTTVRFGANEDSGQPDVRSLDVNPARAEEGEIAGASREIIAFPSTWTIDAATQIRSGRVQVTGSVHAVDRDRLEREIADGKSVWELDPAGKAMADETVTATFTESIPHRVKIGTRYDFIEKTVVPVYEYGSTERAAGTVRVTTGKDGAFSVSVPASAAGHSYRVRLSATDPDKHSAVWVGWASEAGEPGAQGGGGEPTLGLTSAPGEAGDFGVGDPIDLTMTDPGSPAHTTDRYLFYSAQQGLRDADVQASPRYRATFESWAPPGIDIVGIRFTGSGYVESPTFNAAFRRSDREITVGLTTDAARYDPGAEVTITVTTRDRTGGAIPATVVLRAVDEKLFAIYGAQAADPLGELYQGLSSGILTTYRSHHEPRVNTGTDTAGGGGDDRAGGGREDFRDWVLFREIDTGQDGRAVVTFRVSDDLTSWRVSASAFGAGPSAGEGSIGIPVGLPFFADATIASEYLVSDRPSIGLRAFGTALGADAAVTFAIDSDSLALHVSGLKAKAFETATVPLPKLTVGSHKVTITATTGSGASTRRDVMTRTFNVVSSRLARTRAAYVEPTAQTRLAGGEGRVEVIVSDAGASRYIPLLLGLTDVESARLERTLAAALAGSLATDRLKLADAVRQVKFDGATYQQDDGGLAIFPYGSSDLKASVLAALVAPDRFDAGPLEAYLSEIAGSAKETRERRTFALAGLGGLHAAVLPRIRAASADPALTVRERLMLGLGAAALGDAATARSIGASLEAQYSEVTSEHARLRVGSSAADITEGTALMAMLAAANGDPLAARFWAYVEANPGTEAPYELHAVGFVTRVLERGVPRAASFAYTIGDKRNVVALDAGGTFHISVTHAQLGSLTIEPVSGQIGVTTRWQETVKPSAFGNDPDITISRRMTPSGKIGAANLVTVDLTVRIGSKAPTGCHLVTDLVPSGLVPVGNLEGWGDPEAEDQARRDATYPYAQIGQRISFCAEKSKRNSVIHLRYFARVVTSGTYTWEPAIVESRASTGHAALTKASVVTIR